MSSAQKNDIKSKAREAIESLPDDVSWDDVMHRLYVRQKIESGLKDVVEGNTVTITEVRKRFGLAP